MVSSKQIEFLDKVFVRRPYFETSSYRVDNLRDVLKNNAFKNAIWLASPEFFNELEKKNFDYQLLNPKERLTVLKFYNRMSFRGTPFGAFSTFGLTNWDNKVISRKNYSQTYTLHLLPSVQRELKDLQSKPLTDEIYIAINPTLYKLSLGWRYYRYEEDNKGKLSFPVYLLQYDPVDELLLNHLKDGSLSLDILIKYLVELTDCTRDEGANHIARLIDEQVLMSSNTLSLLTNRAAIKHQKLIFDNELRLFDKDAIIKLAKAENDNGKSFYAGLEMHNIAGLSVEWKQDILEALHMLDCIAPIPPKNNLDKFREAFEQKFGDRSVPLLEALDPDLGVAFDNDQQQDEHELLKGVVFKEEPKKNDQLIWTPVHQMLTKVWLQNHNRSAWEPVVITSSDIANLPGNTLPFPPSTSVFCSLSGDKVIFQNVGGSTANALTGRFSAFSETFDSFCKEVARLEKEANPQVLFAEIEQVSNRKIDNINRRKQIYDHVIALNTFPSETDILPKDIDVKVRKDEIILVHRPTAKRLISRLPTAFNYHHNEMPLFRFLCALQYKSIRANFDFDPEKIFPGLSFYPRIEYGRCVISLARWYLKDHEVTGLAKRPFSISKLHLFCRERGITPKISVGKEDQQLFFDLSNDDEAVFFLETLVEQTNVVLTESLVNNCRLGNKVDKFNSQFIISLRNLEQVYAPLSLLPQPKALTREFLPGSEWVYMKIYATNQSVAYILSDVIFPWIQQNKNRIEQWFFVRYYDTGNHIRLRLKTYLTEVKDLQFELQSLLNPFHKSGLVQKLHFDIYQREIERYHGDLISYVEQAFFKGSEMIASRLTGNMLQNHDDTVWPIVHCYQIVSAFFDFDYDQINQLFAWAAEGFFKEHGADKDLKRSMDDRYRELRPDLFKAIGEGQDEEFGELSLEIRKLSKESKFLSNLERQKLIADIIHMQVNRMFTCDQRRYETFIWHCLSKIAVTIMKKQLSMDVSIIDDR